MPLDASEHDGPTAPDGTLWWELTVEPGTRSKPFGQERRLAAWLWFNKEIGDIFTMNELRDALGPDIVGKSEHLNRRLRTLRAVGWVLPSNKDDGSLRPDEYRVQVKGARYWLAEDRRAHRPFAPSARVRREVFLRDDSRCVVCGIAAGESYPGEPNNKAALTIGHRVPQERLRTRRTADDIDNWRTECARCNEPVRDEIPDPRQHDEVLAQVRRLNRANKRTLLGWLQRGERTRSELDRVYDHARVLTHNEKEDLIAYLQSSAGSSS
ncbi:HNH endonuclease [Streptomyces sp. NPDC093261]|uniref:HNH endonuclease n=1 Tax=Streptomyces sp. NPDC093261 TaxID=3366037 RepID=UPI0037F8DC98